MTFIPRVLTLYYKDWLYTTGADFHTTGIDSILRGADFHTTGIDFVLRGADFHTTGTDFVLRVLTLYYGY